MFAARLAVPIVNDETALRWEAPNNVCRVNILATVSEHATVVSHLKLEASSGSHAAPERPLPPEVVDALARRGIDSFYTHQARALDLVRRGVHTVMATATASGKSAVYQAAALEAALGGGTTLYLAPTRALAADQLKAAEQIDPGWLVPATYDSDTPKQDRTAIRRSAKFILTNPDMLHIGILPNHGAWSGFLRRLNYIVIDEAHIYRGVFGSHVALVLRRLARIAARYGSEPVFIAASATISNAAAHASALTGSDVTAVTDDTAPAGERDLIVAEPGSDRSVSANTATARILADLVDAGVRTLAFSKSRVNTELVSEYARSRLTDPSQVASYRAGYLLEERRELESGLRDGRLKGVSTTSALELGIDIGDIDAVLCNGFPGTVAAVRQRSGRAGRKGDASATVMITGPDPLDAWWARNPERLWSGPAEAALVNPDNPYLLSGHLACAAWEQPLQPGEVDRFGPDAHETVNAMIDAGTLRTRRSRIWFAGTGPPAPEINLRAASGRGIRIVEAGTGRLIATTDTQRARTDLHPGAVHLHRGETFSVRVLDLEDGIALVEPTDPGTYTQARSDTDVVVRRIDERQRLGAGHIQIGTVEVTNTVTGYERKITATGEVVERVALEMPPSKLATRAVWYTVGFDELGDALDGLGAPDVELAGLHAAEHGAIALLPAFALCDRWDIGGLSMCPHPDTELPTWFIYDGYPGGAGLTDHAYLVAPAHLSAVRELIAACDCDDGCPRCVQSPKCGNLNDLLDPAAAVRILDLFV